MIFSFMSSISNISAVDYLSARLSPQSPTADTPKNISENERQFTISSVSEDSSFLVLRDKVNDWSMKIGLVQVSKHSLENIGNYLAEMQDVISKVATAEITNDTKVSQLKLKLTELENNLSKFIKQTLQPLTGLVHKKSRIQISQAIFFKKLMPRIF